MPSPVDILAFGAHPDDVEFGMGGSLLKFIREGRSAVICSLSKGGGGSYGTAGVRGEEMHAAARFAGVSLEVLDFEDCRIFDSYENRMTIASVIRRYRPRIVFAPYHTNMSSHMDGASHPDHLAAGHLVQTGARYARFKGLDLPEEPWKVDYVFYYILPRFMEPAFVIDVTPYMEEWEQFCRFHASQLLLKNGNVIDFLRQIRAYYGQTIDRGFGEAFVSDAPVPLELEPLLG